MYPLKINGTDVPYTATYQELCEYLKTPGPLAWAACIALAHQGTTLALEKLVELTRSPDWRFRRSAVEAIGDHPQAEQVMETFRKTLHDPSEHVIKTTCQVSAKLKAVPLHDDVSILLASTNPQIRQAALRTLSVTWQTTDFDEVFRLFLTDQAENVSKEAAWVLRAHVTSANWLSLFKAWWQDPFSRHRKWACEIALLFHPAEVKKELVILLNDEDGHVRKAAMKALEHLYP